MADQTFAVHCGFFDAIDSDRTYSADEMNRPYRRVISNGVFATPQGNPSTDLQVVESSGMNIICKAGEGLFADKWFENPSSIVITVPNNTSTVSRIDSVLVQVDTRTSGRVGNIVYRTGTPASSPTPPAINQTEGVVEYRLANIRVNAGVTSIMGRYITDRRGSSDCPWVTSLIYQVDTSTLYDQWQAAYAEYFEQEKAIWDAWYAQLTEDLDVSMTLDRHINTVTTTAQTTGTIPIGLDYNHNTDILEVYINGLRAIEGIHYVVVNDDTSIMVENQLDIGQAVTFVVMRSVISGSATNITVLLQELESQIAGIAGGTPTVVDSTSDMTEHDKIYVLSTDSKWYYYSATAEDWVIGGTYGGVPTDTTLSISGAPADAKAVGEALAGKADADDLTALDTRATAVEGDISDLKADLKNRAVRYTGNLIANTALADGYTINVGNGNTISTQGWSVTDFIPLMTGERYENFDISNSSFAFYDVDKNYVDLRQNPSVCQSNKLLTSFVLPDDVSYGRFSIINSNIGQAFLCAYKLPQNGFTIDSKLVSLTDEAFSGLVANVANMCQNSVLTLDPRMYEHGAIDRSSGAFITYQYARRAKSRFNQIYPFDIKITPENGASILVLIYNADGTFVPSGTTYTTNPLVVPANSPFMLNLAYTQDATVESICEKVTIEKLKTELPYYYYNNDYIKNKVDAIVNKSPLDGLQFAFLTDVHVRKNAGKSPYLIKYLKENTNAVPFVVFGGDVLVTAVPDGVGPLEDAYEWQKWLSIMHKPDVYQVQGNHDYLGKYYDNGTQTWYYAPLGVCRQFVVGNLENSNIVGVSGKPWYYVDIPTAKTRIVFLNDYDTTRNNDAFHGYNGMSVDQIEWVVEKALDTDGIRVIFVSHQGYDSEMDIENPTVFTGIQSLFTAIANHTSYSYGRVSKDFTNSTIKFVAHLCGHMHDDASNVNDGVLTIQTTCDALYGPMGGSDATREATVGTVNEQAFDIVTVDYTNEKLYTTRIGYGNDREFNLT